MTVNPAKLYNFEAGYLAEMVQRTSLSLMLKLTALWTPILLRKQPIHHLSVKPKRAGQIYHLQGTNCSPKLDGTPALKLK